MVIKKNLTYTWYDDNTHLSGFKLMDEMLRGRNDETATPRVCVTVSV